MNAIASFAFDSRFGLIQVRGIWISGVADPHLKQTLYQGCINLYMIQISNFLHPFDGISLIELL